MSSSLGSVAGPDYPSFFFPRERGSDGGGGGKREEILIHTCVMSGDAQNARTPLLLRFFLFLPVLLGLFISIAVNHARLLLC